MRHQRPDPIRITRGQVEPDLRASAVAQHISGLAAQLTQKLRRVVAVNIHVLILRRPVNHAARVTARVIARNRIVGGQQAGDAGEDAGISRTARDHQEHRARALPLVVNLRALYFEQRRLDRHCFDGHDGATMTPGRSKTYPTPGSIHTVSGHELKAC
jgi:hypothetical protein